MRLKSVATIGVALFVSSADAQKSELGGVYECAGMPRFIRSLGLQQPVAIDTSRSQLPGVVLRELTGRKRVYQKEGWKITGHVGSTVRDLQGSIYAAPIPSVSLDTNPMEKRNTIFRIRSQDGELETYKSLPMPSNTSQRNPFGVLGMAIDCDTNSLYVSSVAGSTPEVVAGVIYQIDLSSRKIVDSFRGIDAIGLSVYNSTSGKKLYLGDTRSSALYTLDLKHDGQFVKGQVPNYSLSLLALKNGDSTQVRKIRFTEGKRGEQLMTLDETEFAFRPAAETTRRYKKYFFKLDDETLKWVLLSIRY